MNPLLILCTNHERPILQPVNHDFILSSVHETIFNSHLPNIFPKSHISTMPLPRPSQEHVWLFYSRTNNLPLGPDRRGTTSPFLPASAHTHPPIHFHFDILPITLRFLRNDSTYILVVSVMGPNLDSDCTPKGHVRDPERGPTTKPAAGLTAATSISFQVTGEPRLTRNPRSAPFATDPQTRSPGRISKNTCRSSHRPGQGENAGRLK